MKISVTDAKAQLTELVRRAAAGEEVVLTRHGAPAARLVPVKRAGDPVQRRNVLEAISRAGAAKGAEGPSAARSQDFLYDDDGMPR
jgi:prevent-host-death family protein